MKRILLTATICAAIAGCDNSGNLSQQGQKIVAVLCKVDKVAQPIVVSVAPTLLPQLTVPAQLDTILIHPEVVKQCPADSVPVGVLTPAASGGTITVAKPIS